MKKVELNKDKYMEGLVMMFYRLGKGEMEVKEVMMVELLKRADRGYVVVEEVRDDMMVLMGMKRGYFEKTLLRMCYDGVVRREGGVLYFAPKYLAIVRSEGNFMISEKKSLDGGE